LHIALFGSLALRPSNEVQDQSCITMVIKPPGARNDRIVSSSLSCHWSIGCWGFIQAFFSFWASHALSRWPYCGLLYFNFNFNLFLPSSAVLVQIVGVHSIERGRLPIALFHDVSINNYLIFCFFYIDMRLSCFFFQDYLIAMSNGLYMYACIYLC
jgi:uncharacterized protein with PQ loop repeat